MWGREWSALSIRCWCDNAAVVSVINTGWCQDKHLMYLMRCLFFYAARFCFCLSARHIAGAANLYNVSRADTLFWNKMSNFFSIFPQANPTSRSSTTIPTGASNRRQPGLDITSLEGSILQLIRDSIAPSTRCTYVSAQNRYISFCQHTNATPFPVLVYLLCNFIAFLGSQGL